MTAPIQLVMRRPLSEHSQAVGKQMLHIRLYQESIGYLCERELVEADGTGFVQAFPFRRFHQAQEFLKSDPHFTIIKKGANKILDCLALEVSNENSSSKA